MKSFLAGLALATIIAGGSALAADPAAPDTAKQAAAERYLATQDFNADVNGLVATIGQMIRNPAISPDQKQQFMDFTRDHLDRAMLKQALLNAMMETYTTEELNALADFYGSPLGHGIGGKAQAFNHALGVATIPVAVGFLRTYAMSCTDKSKCIDLSLLMPPTAPPAPAK